MDKGWWLVAGLLILGIRFDNTAAFVAAGCYCILGWIVLVSDEWRKW